VSLAARGSDIARIVRDRFLTFLGQTQTGLNGFLGVRDLYELRSTVSALDYQVLGRRAVLLAWFVRLGDFVVLLGFLRSSRVLDLARSFKSANWS